MKKFTHIALLLALAWSLLLIDFYTKAYIYSFLPLSGHESYFLREIRVFEDVMGIDFAITLALNKGIAWGAMSNFQHLILVVRIVVIVGMLCYLFFAKHDRRKDIPLILIITGALGNVVDYFLYGSVVDFLRFNLWGYPFPIFNVADLLITVGVVSFFLLSFFQKEKISQKKVKQ